MEYCSYFAHASWSPLDMQHGNKKVGSQREAVAKLKIGASAIAREYVDNLSPFSRMIDRNSCSRHVIKSLPLVSYLLVRSLVKGEPDTDGPLLLTSVRRSPGNIHGYTRDLLDGGAAQRLFGH